VKLYIIDTIETFSNRYAIRCKDENELLEILNGDEAEFYSQDPVTETVVKYALIDEEAFLEDFDRCNPDLVPLDKEMKMTFINETDYEEDGSRINKKKMRYEMSQEDEPETVSEEPTGESRSYH
jgi:hypothetical protein